MPAPADSPEAFIDYWSKAGAGEMANSHSFVIGLTALLGLPQPDHNHADGYGFNFPVTIADSKGA